MPCPPASRAGVSRPCWRRKFKERIIPGFEGDIVWDVWVLFDEEATWSSADEHVVDWGSTVVATESALVAQLEHTADR